MLEKNNKGILAISMTFFLLTSLLIGFFRRALGNPFWISGEHYQYLISSLSHETLTGMFFNYFSTNILATIYLIPFLLGIISIFIFSKISKKYATTDKEYYLSLVLLLTLPLFIKSHMVLSDFSLFLILTLLSIYYYNKQNFSFYLSLFTLSLFFPTITIFLLPVLIYFNFKDKAFTGLSTLTIFLANLILFILKLPKTYSWLSLPSAGDIFGFFGAQYGYTIIILLFGITYIYSEDFKKSFPSKYLILIYFLLSLFNVQLRWFMLLCLLFFASKNITNIINHKWSEDILKYAVILLIACILFFSLSTAIQDTITQPPTKSQIDALKYLNFIRSNLDEGKLLTHPTYSSFIKYYSGVDAYLDGSVEKEKLANSIFYSRQYSKISEILIQENIRYILIDLEMTSGLIWSNNREDLLFVIKYSDNFKEIYSKDEVKIYYFNSD